MWESSVKGAWGVAVQLRSSPNVDTARVMIADSNSKLVGTWKLVSASTVDSSGKRDEAPYGANPVGLLTYTQDGRMTALISYDGRKPLSIGANSSTSLVEQAAAFKTFLAYGGRYRLNGDSVIHSVEIASIQSWVNQELVRRVKFQGDRIMLTTPPTRVNGKLQTFELVWQRVEDVS